MVARVWLTKAPAPWVLTQAWPMQPVSTELLPECAKVEVTDRLKTFEFQPANPLSKPGFWTRLAEAEAEAKAEMAIAAKAKRLNGIKNIEGVKRFV